jgi:CRP/FNR family cyclic AMP-dependent transcriptional regulator
MRFPLLEGLDEGDQADVLRRARRRRFRAREVVFHEGDPSDSLHLLAHGHVAIRITTLLGDVVTLRVLRAGDFFGELAVVTSAPRNATVVALDAVETLALHRDVFEEIRRRDASVDRLLVVALAAEVQRLSVALVEALHLPVEKRLWRRLNDLVQMYELDAGAEIPITQEELAELAGTTRSTANRILVGGVDAGVVRLRRGHIQVDDLGALERRAR